MQSRCPACQSLVAATHKFCGECGARLDEAPTIGYTPENLQREVLSSRAAREGEHKVVSVLFCDVVGSTTLAEQLGPGPMHRVLSRFFEAALAQIHGYGGTVNQFLGDGLMALFGAPVAQEDHARRAVLAGLGLQSVVVPRLREEMPECRGLALRVAVHSGPVVVGSLGDQLRQDYTAVGDTTNVAARLQSLCGSGQVLVSKTVQQAAAAWVSFEPEGLRQLKGRIEPVEVFRACAPLSPASMVVADADLFGREEEIAQLRADIGALAQGRGGVDVLSGPAGIGKSALTRCAHGQAATLGMRFIAGHCLPFGHGQAYHPLHAIVRTLVCSDEDSATTPLDWYSFQQGVRALLGPDDSSSAPYLAVLAGITPPAGALTDSGSSASIQPYILRGARELLIRAARRKPIVLLIEDTHWADGSTCAVLGHLLPVCATDPVLVVVTMRGAPEAPPQALVDALTNHGGKHLELGPLGAWAAEDRTWGQELA